MNQTKLTTKLLTVFVLFGYSIGLSSVFLPMIEYAVDYRRIVAEKWENLAKQIVKQTAPETTEAGANIVVLNLGIDPHFSIEASTPLSFKYSELFLSQNNMFTSIIMEQVDPPPEC